MQLFYRAGVDPRGRPVFLFWAGHLPSRPVDLERVLMHLMRTLDPHMHSEYIVVYVHTTLSPENEPPLAWLRKVYDLFDRRLKENLYLMCASPTRRCRIAHAPRAAEEVTCRSHMQKSQVTCRCRMQRSRADVHAAVACRCRVHAHAHAHADAHAHAHAACTCTWHRRAMPLVSR
eukprot:5718691-Prymnesium_polylepis.1